MSVACGLLCFLAVQTAAQQPVRATLVTAVEGITEYSLPNGLRVLLFPDSSKATVTVNVTYMVGSRHEAYGETGMAHLLEHLQFKGTPLHANIPAELNKHGARWNASTWLDRTNYYEVMPATPANVAWGLALEADRMTHSRIAEHDRQSEMTVVRNEFELGENFPFNILMERTLSTAYLWHNYGHSTIGARSDIERVPIERLQAFYHRYYQPDNALLLVAGKFAPTATLQVIEQRFGRVPRPVRSAAHGNALYPTYTEEPTQDGERSVTLRRSGDVQLAMAVFHVPALAHTDFASVDVLSRLLGDEPAGRLYRSLVVPRLAARAGSFTLQLKEPGTLIAYAEVRRESSLDSARSVMLRTIDSVRTRPPSAEEVDRARTALLKNIDLLLNNSDQVGLSLSEWQAAGDWRLLFVHRDRLRRVTPADVQRVARAYLKPSNATVGLFYPDSAPDRSEIPGDVDVASLVHGYKGDTSVARGEAFDASPANIDARTEVARLPNGMRLSLLSKKTRGAQVNGLIKLRYGSEQSLSGQSTAAELTREMLDRGTRTLSRQQLKDSLDHLKARIQVLGGPEGTTLLIETVRASVAPVLALAADMVRRPALDSAEFERLRQEQLSEQEQARSLPESRAFTTFRRRIEPRPPEHPLYTPTEDEHIALLQKATLAAVRDFHARFYGGAAADLVLIGDFDSTAVRAQSTSLFGDWRAAEPWTRLPHPYRQLDSSTTVLETPDKANAVLVAGVDLPLRDDGARYAALVVGNYILGGGPLASRLADRIRQKEGLSYAIGSSFDAQSSDTSGEWTAFAISAPQNSERVVAALREEIARILKDGVTADEVAKAKASWLQDHQQSRSNDDELSWLIVERREFDRTLAYDAELERRVQAVTVPEVNAALRQYIAPERLTVVRAGDFAKAKEAAPVP